MRFLDAGSRRFSFACLLVSCCSAVAAPAVVAESARSVSVSSGSADSIARLSIPFVPNRGQTDNRVAYLARTFAGTLFVTLDGEIVYSLLAPDGGPARTTGPGTRPTSS